MMVILVILLVLQTVLSAPSNHPVSAEECHVVACVKAIMASYFTPGRPTAVVISRDADIRQRVFSNGLKVNTPPRRSSGGNYTNMRIVLGRSHKENIHQNAFSNLQGINTRQSEFIFEHHINNFQHYLCDYHLPDFMMQALSQEARWPFVIVRLPNNKIKPQLHLEPHEQYLIIIGRMESEVISALHRIIVTSMPLRTQGRFIVILTNEFLQNKVLHLETLRDLTDHLSLNAVFIVPNSQYNSLQHHNHTAQVLDLYSWFPAGTGKHCVESRQLARINQWRINGDGRFLTKHNLFPSITPTDIHGCTLTVRQFVEFSTVQLSYLEKLIVNEIANSLRAHVTSAERPTDAHIILGGIPLNTVSYPKHTLFHLSHPYLFTTLKVTVVGLINRMPVNIAGLFLVAQKIRQTYYSIGMLSHSVVCYSGIVSTSDAAHLQTQNVPFNGRMLQPRHQHSLPGLFHHLPRRSRSSETEFTRLDFLWHQLSLQSIIRWLLV